MVSPIWALAIAVFAVGVDAYIVAGIVPEIARDLDEPLAAVGLVASAYALPTALLAPVFGPLSDRRGRRTALSIGLVVFVVSAAACVVAPGLPLLLIARGMNGLGAAIMLPAAFAYAGDMPDQRERDRAMGLLASSFPLATLLGLPLGAVAATLAGWRGAFVFITLVGIAALLLVRALCPADRPRHAEPMSYRASYRAILADRSALALLAVTFVWFLAPLGLFIYFAEFVHITYDIPTTQAGLSLIVVGIVGVTASRVSGRFMSVIGARNAVLLAISAFGTAALLMPLSTAALPLSLLVLALWASGTWFGIPAMQTIVSAHTERLRGTMLAFNSSALNLAGVVGPALIGAIVTASGFHAAYWSAALVAAAAFSLAWVVLPRGEVVEPSEPAQPAVVGE
ncbi:MAG TPA: MFS transporter [Candidatus Limnocylindrales bacterium]|nr:MFS transporter [Candidatus Limnocylindrales bacterium]